MRKLISKRLFAVLMAALLFAALGTTALADDAPVINTDVPAALTVIEGQTLTLTVEATGGELSYQWYRVHPEGDTPVEGQTSNTYQIASVDASINGAAFYCFVQNVAGNTQSSVCTVTVLSKPVLTQDVSTTSQTLTEGDTIALTAGATGAAGIQWYYKKGDEAPKPVDGATTASLSVAATMEYNGADIYCQFVNDAGAVTTSFCRITVNAKPAAPVTTKNPTDETVTEGGRAIFIARADGATSYLWRIISADGTQVYDYTAARTAFPTLSISGGDSETLTLTNIPYDMNGWKVACLFKSEGGETLSDTASVTVTKKAASLSIITQPVGGTMAVDENPNFILSIQATSSDGGTITYQWYSAATNSTAAMKAIPGATTSSYKPEQTEGTTYYRVSVQLTGNGTTSDPYYSNTVPVTFTATKTHTHSFSSVWEHNDLSHWHQCTCGEHGDEAFHTYTWTILKAPTATEDGEQKGVCSVCGYETIQPIPAGTDTGEEETPAKPAKKTNTVLLVIIGVLAVAVIAVAVILVRKVLLQKDEEDSGDDEE